VYGRKGVLEVGDQGTIWPSSFLQSMGTGWERVEEEVAFEARAADHMSWGVLVRNGRGGEDVDVPRWGL
jgi:hypothetical protein